MTVHMIACKEIVVPGKPEGRKVSVGVCPEHDTVAIRLSRRMQASDDIEALREATVYHTIEDNQLVQTLSLSYGAAMALFQLLRENGVIPWSGNEAEE